MEVARKNQLAKGEDGLKELKAAPTLAQFAENEFLQFIEKHKKTSRGPSSSIKLRWKPEVFPVFLEQAAPSDRHGIDHRIYCQAPGG